MLTKDVILLCPTWLDVQIDYKHGHYDQGGHLFVQLDQMFNFTNQISHLVKFTSKKYTCHSSPGPVAKMYMSTNKKKLVSQFGLLKKP